MRVNANALIMCHIGSQWMKYGCVDGKKSLLNNKGVSVEWMRERERDISEIRMIVNGLIWCAGRGKKVKVIGPRCERRPRS